MYRRSDIFNIYLTKTLCAQKPTTRDFQHIDCAKKNDLSSWSHVSVFAHVSKMSLSRLASSTTRHALRNVRALSSERPEPQQVESLLQIGSRRIYDSTHDAYREVSYNPTSKN